MNDINLATADKQELKTWAINNIDLQLSMTMNEDTMRQRIIDKCHELQIEPPKAVVEEKRATKGKKQDYYTIIIAKTEKPGGTEPAIVGVQGVLYSIPRGIPIDVPGSVVEVLKNGMQDIVTQDPETNEIHHEDVPTYPYQVIGKVA